MIDVDALQWEKAAFAKLARLGAIVFLPTKEDKYLMQVADEGDESEAGGLRPPGGGKERKDKDLEATIIREIKEEFSIPESVIKGNLRFLGYEYREPFWGNAVFELKNHGLEPGDYQASNHHLEKIKLVEAGLDHSDYVGPDPELLLSEEEKKDAEETEADTKAAFYWDIFKEAKSEDLHDLFEPDYTPTQMEERAQSRHRLYHKLAPRLASMLYWPREWNTDTDPGGWLEWYEQYDKGRRSPDDSYQIRRWLNFKARHGRPYARHPSPRRGWALVNWAIDPLKLLDPKERPAARKEMEEFKAKIDKRYADDQERKQAAAVGLERPIKRSRFIRESELIAIGEGRMDPLTLEPLIVVSPDGDSQPLTSYIKKMAATKQQQADEIVQAANAGHGRYIGSCGHVIKQCRCKMSAHPDLQFQVLSSCQKCREESRAKHASAEQGVMSGNSIDGAAPSLLPAVAADQDPSRPFAEYRYWSSTAPDNVGAPVSGLKPSIGERLRRLHERRGENPDGTINMELLNSGNPVKIAGYFSPENLKARTRRECIDCTGNSNPTENEISNFASQRLREIYAEQDKEAQVVHERVLASAKEGTCPNCGDSENFETAIVKGKIRCGKCRKISPHVGWGVTKVAAFPKDTRFHQPENFDKIEELCTKGFRVSAGGNDWEDTWTGVAFTFGGDSEYGRRSRIWGKLNAPEHLTNANAHVPKSERDWGKNVVKMWIDAADEQRKELGSGVGKESWRPEHFMAAAKTPELKSLIKEHGEDVMVWEPAKSAASGEMIGEQHPPKSEPPAGSLTGILPVRLPDPRAPKKLPAGYSAMADQAKPASTTAEQGPALDIPPSSTSATGVKTPMAEHQVGKPIAAPVTTDLTPKVSPSVMQDQQADLSPTLAGQSKAMGSAPTIAETAYPIGAKAPISQGIGSLPMGVLGQQSPMMQAQRQPHPLAQVAPAALPQLQKTAMAIDSAGIPTTGPESILYALHNLDLAKKESDAKSVIQRKLKSKRPDAVKVLNYIEGLRRADIKPHELMISRVPVIPPQFRPYSVAGDTFVPGDANELYRDLINLVGVHSDIESRLGKIGSGFSRLNVYDAVKAVYGYGEPTSPKTRERGVSGFLTKVVGGQAKFSFPQRKLLSKDMDYTGNSVIGVDPDLGLDQIGIPEEMAWKLYSPYVQRRLVRAGMSPEQAVKYIADRHQTADKMLSFEMKERPVVYGRQPSWHKYNVIGGWPQRIKGNMIRINPLVTTGLNADFDGDTMNVHLPSMPSAVQDARDKLMASKQLFSMKDRTKVMPAPKQEFILGLWSAQRRKPKQMHQFPNEHAALAAIRSGDVRLSDDIQIGKPTGVKMNQPMPELMDTREPGMANDPEATQREEMLIAKG